MKIKGEVEIRARGTDQVMVVPNAFSQDFLMELSKRITGTLSIGSGPSPNPGEQHRIMRDFFMSTWMIPDFMVMETWSRTSFVDPPFDDPVTGHHPPRDTMIIQTETLWYGVPVGEGRTSGSGLAYTKGLRSGTSAYGPQVGMGGQGWIGGRQTSMEEDVFVVSYHATFYPTTYQQKDRYDYEEKIVSSDTQAAKYEINLLELRGYVPGDHSGVTSPRSGKLISSVNPQQEAYPRVLEFEAETPLDVTWNIKFGRSVYGIPGEQVYTSFDINPVWGDRVSQILLGRPVVNAEEAVLRGGHNATNPEHDLLTRKLLQGLEGVDDTRVTDGAGDVPSTVFDPRLIPYDDYWLEGEIATERADRFIRLNGITLYDDSGGQMRELSNSGFEMLWQDPSLIGTARYEMTQDVSMVPFETHQYKAGDVLASGIVLTEDGQLVHGVMVHDVMSSSPPTHFSLWAEYAGTGRLYQAPLTAEPIAISRWNIGFDQYDRNDVLVTFGLRLGQYEDVG